MAEFSTGKTIFVLAIVVGCFAILWPKIFYPMLISSLHGDPPLDNVPPVDTVQALKLNQCCDVISETDVTAIKVLEEMCGDILLRYPGSIAGASLTVGVHLSRAAVERCRDEVMTTCGLDIAAMLRDNQALTKNYKHILDEIRSYNNSACLKRNFGVQTSLLGTPRLMGMFREKTARHLRPERPAHLHPDMLHPALREKGRAIPQQQPQRPLSVGAITGLDGTTVTRLPGQPLPGYRPPMGGAGHVVPAPKGSGTMGIVMPLYTVGIVVFFVYTIMKVLFKKTDERIKVPEFGMDPELRRMMFGATAMEECAQAAQEAAVTREQPLPPEFVPPPPPAAQHAATNGFRAPTPPDARPSSKLGDAEMDQLRRRLEETEAAMERIVAQMSSGTGDSRSSHLHALDKAVPRQEEDEREGTEELNGADISPTVETQKHAAEFIEDTPAEEEDHVAAEEEDDAELDLDPKVTCEEEEPEVPEGVLDTGEDEHRQEALRNGHPAPPERTVTPVQQLLEEGGSGKVTVLGMETTARCENGHRWTGRPPTPETPPRSNTPQLQPLYAIEQFAAPPAPPHYRWARPPTPPTPPRSTTPLFHPSAVAPHAYLLETAAVVPGHGHHGILVSDSECEALPAPLDPETDPEDDEDSPPVILSGKMTLSVIALPDTPAAELLGSAPASPALPRRAMHVAPANLEEMRPEHGVDERVKATEQVNGEQEESSSKPNGEQQDDASMTNYTTASAAAAEETAGERLEETSADISGIDDEHAEAADNDEPAAEVEDLPQDEPPRSNGLL